MSTTGSLPRIGSAVVVEKDGKILLGVRGKDPNRGKWVLPGGRIERFEKVFEAAKRELLEETGLEVDIKGFIDFQEIINPPNEHRIIVFSRATVIRGKAKPSSDLEDVRFFSPDELRELDISETVRIVLERFLDQKKKKTGHFISYLIKLPKRAWRKSHGDRAALTPS